MVAMMLKRTFLLALVVSGLTLRAPFADAGVQVKTTESGAAAAAGRSNVAGVLNAAGTRVILSGTSSDLLSLKGGAKTSGGAGSGVLFDNSTSTNNSSFGQFFAPALGTEFGNQLILSGPSVVTNFAVQYYAPTAGGNIELKIYANNGVLKNAGDPSSAQPGTLIFDSGTYVVPSTSPGGSVVTFSGLNVTVPATFTWTVSFTATGTPAPTIGLDIFGPPTVGHIYNDIWETNAPSGWTLLGPTVSGASVVFGATVQGYPIWQYNNLHTFTLGDGAPIGNLVQGTNGVLYGVDQAGFFSVTTAGVYTHIANNPVPSVQLNALAQGSDGNFYAALTSGFLVQFTTSGGAKLLGSTYGSLSALTAGSDGFLYGSSFGSATLSQIGVPSGSSVNKYSLNGLAEGGNPSGLIQGADGSFYAACAAGGVKYAGNGVVIQVTPPTTPGGIWTINTLHYFSDTVLGKNTDGASPTAALVQGRDGYLYGVTTAGGANGFGTVFQLSTNGSSYSVIYNFTSTDTDGNPGAYSSLIQGADGLLYGVSLDGGLHGSGAVFSLSASGGPLTTVYSFGGTSGNTDGIEVANATTSGLTSGNGVIQGVDGDLYGLANSGGANGAGVAFQLVNPNPPPVITAQPVAPVGGTVTAGGSTTLSVTASASLPLSYQWTLNGTNIPGATSASLALTGISPAQAGTYQVLVTDANGSVASQTVSISVPTVITWTNPVDGNWSDATKWTPQQVPGQYNDVVIGKTGSYAVTVDINAAVNSLDIVGGSTNGYENLIINKSFTLGSANSTNYIGSTDLGDTAGLLVNTNGSLVINGTLMNDGVIESYTGFTLAPGAALENNFGVEIFGGTVNLGSGSFIQSEFFFATLGGSITGAGTFTNDWYFIYYGPGTNTAPTNETISSLFVNNTNAVVLVIGDVPSPFSPSLIIENGVNNGTNYAAGSGQIVLGSATLGGDGEDNSDFSSGYLPANSQIQLASLKFRGEPRIKFKPPVAKGNSLSGTFTFTTVTNASGSNAVSALIVPTNGTLNVTFAPSTNSVPSTNTLSVVGVLSSSGSVQIQGSGNVSLGSTNGSSGQVQNNPGGSLNIQGDVSVSSSGGTNTTLVNQGTLVYNPGSNSVATVSTPVVNTGSLSVQSGSVSVNNTGATGVAPVSGAGNSLFLQGTATQTNTSVVGAGTFTTSSNATLTIPNQGLTITNGASLVAPSFTTQPQSLVITPGTAVTFTGAATGTAPLALQWSYNGNAIPGATNASYSITPAQTTNAGVYTLAVTNVIGSASANATLTVATAPVITAQPQSLVVNQGASIVLTAAASGFSPLSYQWQFNGTNLSGATSATLSLPSLSYSQAGSYSLVVTNLAGAATTTNAVVTVTIPVAQTLAIGQLSGTTFSFNMPSQQGVIYELESTTTLLKPNWQIVQIYVGTGGIITLSDPNATGGFEFYRVVTPVNK